MQLNWTTCFVVAGYVAANPAVREAFRWAARAALTVEWRRLAVPAYVLIAIAAMPAGTPAATQVGTAVAEMQRPSPMVAVHDE